MDGTQDPLTGSRGEGRIRPLAVARAVQVMLVAVVIAVAFVAAPGDRQAATGTDGSPAPLADQDRRSAEFADATAVAWDRSVAF